MQVIIMEFEWDCTEEPPHRNLSVSSIAEQAQQRSMAWLDCGYGDGRGTTITNYPAVARLVAIIHFKEEQPALTH